MLLVPCHPLRIRNSSTPQIGTVLPTLTGILYYFVHNSAVVKYRLLYALPGPECKQLRLLLRPLDASQDLKVEIIHRSLCKLVCVAFRKYKSIYLSIYLYVHFIILKSNVIENNSSTYTMHAQVG
jgi:hypothetical protein